MGHISRRALKRGEAPSGDVVRTKLRLYPLPPHSLNVDLFRGL